MGLDVVRRLIRWLNGRADDGVREEKEVTVGQAHVLSAVDEPAVVDDSIVAGP